MSEYHINAEVTNRTRIGDSPYGTALFEIVVNKGGKYELCFYNGQEPNPQETITNPEDGYGKEYSKRFENGLTYTLVFNPSDCMSQKRVSVTVRYRDALPPSITPLP